MLLEEGELNMIVVYYIYIHSTVYTCIHYHFFSCVHIN